MGARDVGVLIKGLRKLRNELAESLSEPFNPVYRAATEAFYRRVAELSQQQAEQDAQQEGGE